MIEILGIRTGVDEGEEGDESSDEEGNYAFVAGGGGEEEEGRRFHSKRRSLSTGGGGGGGGKNGVRKERERDWSGGGVDRDDGYSNTSSSVGGGGGSTGDSPYRDDLPLRSSSTLKLGSMRRGGSNMGAKSGRFGSVSAPTSDLSSSSSDSDPDILPSAQSAIDLTSKNPGGGGAGTEGGSDRVFANGKWFTVLDETYLLPVFSNATASRKQSAKKAMLKAKRSSFAVDRSSGDLGGDDSFDGGNGSPYPGTGSNHQVNPSFSVRPPFCQSVFARVR